jgi:cysteinyl-tRNA synthetase
MSTQKIQLRFHNSLTRTLEEFIPISGKQVSLYTCGPTVYDSSHIGHARSVIVWDILVRYLKEAGFVVTWARNITDIDDKIINRAKEKNISPEKLARMETFKFWRDMQNLNVSWPELEPRATENLSQMFQFIQGLLDKGFAYQADNGDVYFEVSKFADYGQLKNLSPKEDNISRIEHQTCKEHTADFALWKACPKDEYGYESPFGFGRPGWHLECSSMIKSYFGETIDIHGGGEDLMFPHHENEIAQSEALHGKKFARYWLHNGMIMVEGRKMSKSEGNFITIEQALQKHSANAIRFFILSAHYRQPINYTEQAIEAAHNGISKLLKLIDPAKAGQAVSDKDLDQESMQKFYEAMNDDINTPCALAVLFELSKRIQKNENKLEATLRKLLGVLGFNLNEVNKSCNNSANNEGLFQLLVEMRENARKDKNFALADKIRIQFEQAGYKLNDSSTGTEIIPN